MKKSSAAASWRAHPERKIGNAKTYAGSTKIYYVLLKVIAAGICVCVLSALGWGQERAPVRGRGGSTAGRGLPSKDPKTPKGVYATSHGVVKSITKGLLTIGMDDEHEMKFRITRKTKFVAQDKDGSREMKASSVESGQPVAVDAETALDGSFEAVRVVLEPANAK